MKITLYNPTNRKTPCHIVAIGLHSFIFSYQTCIGYSGPGGSVRIENQWGPTTGRHINEAGIKGWRVVEQDEFERIVENALKGA